jgi:hypothetical protein
MLVVPMVMPMIQQWQLLLQELTTCRSLQEVSAQQQINGHTAAAVVLLLSHIVWLKGIYTTTIAHACRSLQDKK